MSSSERVDSQKAPEPVGLYPHARRVGNLLFLSGVLAWRAASGTFPPVACRPVSGGASRWPPYCSPDSGVRSRKSAR